MVRHRGADIDVERRAVFDRDAQWHELDCLEVAGTALYYARPVPAQGFTYHERWLLPEQGWSISRIHWRDGWHEDFDWYIETEIMAVDGPVWSIRDGFIDVLVWEGLRIRIDDADELGDGLSSGVITVEEAAAALRSLDHLCDELHANGNSGAALLERYAAGLPR